MQLPEYWYAPVAIIIVLAAFNQERIRGWVSRLYKKKRIDPQVSEHQSDVPPWDNNTLDIDESSLVSKAEEMLDPKSRLVEITNTCDELRKRMAGIEEQREGLANKHHELRIIYEKLCEEFTKIKEQLNGNSSSK